MRHPVRAATVGKLLSDALDGFAGLVEKVRVGVDERSVWVAAPRVLNRAIDPTGLLSRLDPRRIRMIVTAVGTWAPKVNDTRVPRELLVSGGSHLREQGCFIPLPVSDAVHRSTIAENDPVVPLAERKLLELALRVENRPLNRLARRLAVFTWKATAEQNARRFREDRYMAA